MRESAQVEDIARHSKVECLDTCSKRLVDIMDKRCRIWSCESGGKKEDD